MKYSKSFLITLGHNSSVIFFDGLNTPIGYEEERLTGIKSDSAYPINAFNKVLSHLSVSEIEGSNVFISHWFDNFNIADFPTKYFNQSHFNDLVNQYNLEVISLSSQFTHHDAHAYSSLAFSENFPTNVKGPKHFIVVDGFGNNQEVISIYEESPTGLSIIKRVYGYENSLGLLYQYATSFCNMKENQDEYKFLGYESKIKEVLNADEIEALQINAYNYSMEFMHNCLKVNTAMPQGDDFDYSAIDYDYLRIIKAKIHSHLHEIVHRCSFFPDDESTRVIVGFYVQACLEFSLLRIINKYNMKNVYLSGGCFLNVKLNKFILDRTTGFVCVNPLSGDQGAAIGLFRKYTNTKFNFSDLCFGLRDRLDISQREAEHFVEEGIYIFNTQEEVIDFTSYMLESNQIVNIIHGNMEFGPRALCNTSTLALPTKQNSEYINMVNERNEVMPMAPVYLETIAKNYMNTLDLSRVIGSNHYMIMTHDFYDKGVDANSFRGILHNKPLADGYTCRPQLVNNYRTLIGRILSAIPYDCLINTSFNTHGRPILFSYLDAITDFRKQKAKDIDNRLILIILNKND